MAKLILGSRLRGWESILPAQRVVTLDAAPGADIQCTLPDLPPAADGPWDAIEWIHGIGYVYQWEAVPLLRELRARLSPGGVLILEQPNISLCCAAYYAAAKAEAAGVKGAVWSPDWDPLKGIYGDPSHKDPLHSYRWGWDPVSLAAACREAGFCTVRVCSALLHVPERDFRIEAKL